MDAFSELEARLSDQIGARLRQAREDKGLSQKEFGEAMGYGASMISAFEGGSRRMKIEDLTRACIVLDKPPEFFLGEISTPTRREPVGLSLRADLETLPGEDLAGAVERLLEEIEADLPSGGPVVDLRELRPEVAAREVLQIAGIDRPQVEMKDVCRALGIPIYRRPLPDSLSAAVMNIDDDAFVIAVNRDHSPKRRRFSVAHEVGHAVLRHAAGYYLEYKVDDHWEPPGYSYFDEREANAFAAALLMDERWVREDFADGIRDVTDLAQRYAVSSEAMGFRLRNLGLD
ncbi:MAG TPA: XRE family transcriptional regulator [Solirubrobacterales bacterium]|nr:XRE family transcriptional regulator [Solirubrobacterales bacterium]